MSGKNNDEWRQQGKQVADAFTEGVGEIRDGLTEQTAKHEDTIKSKLGKVASFLDDKTGGKYTDKLDKANARLSDGVSRVAEEGRNNEEKRRSDKPAEGDDPQS